jgi:hypothetical protein
MEERLSPYDEKVLRRLIEIETEKRKERKDGPLAFIKRETTAGAAMRRLDQMGMIGAVYKDGNPYVIEVLAHGYSYIANIDAEHNEIVRLEQERRSDRHQQWLLAVVAPICAAAGVVLGVLIGHLL